MKRSGRRAIDLHGKRFGRLFVLYRAPVETDGTQRLAKWICRCDCGKEVVRRSLHLRDGSTKSCGCLKAEFDANHARDARGSFIPGFREGPPPRSTVRALKRSEKLLKVVPYKKPKELDFSFLDIKPPVVAPPQPKSSTNKPFSMMGGRTARPLPPGRGRVIEIESGARGSTLADA